MHFDYWQKQDLNKPLFDALVWGKPQQKTQSGKLLIIGGNIHAIAQPAEAYGVAINQGVGECKVVMPNITKKLLGPKPPIDIEFVSSTPSGSFGSDSINELKSYLNWANSALFAGNVGHNSETAILLENIIKTPGQQVYVNDCVDYWFNNALTILRRNDTLLVVDITKLQKLAINARVSIAFTHSMELMQLVQKLHEFTNLFKCNILLKHQDQIFTASKGQVITTKISTDEHWQTKTATAASVWWLQNPNKTLEAIATAITQLN